MTRQVIMSRDEVQTPQIRRLLNPAGVLLFMAPVRNITAAHACTLLTRSYLPSPHAFNRFNLPVCV